MAKDYAALAKKAADLTNKQLGSEITDLARATTQGLDQLLPLKRDKQDFIDLMKIVQTETDEDNAIAKLTKDFARFGKVVVRALKLLA